MQNDNAQDEPLSGAKVSVSDVRSGTLSPQNKSQTRGNKFKSKPSRRGVTSKNLSPDGSINGSLSPVS